MLLSCSSKFCPVFQYDLCLLTFDHILSFAPFTRLNRVLDTGCGVGELWSHIERTCTWHGVELTTRQAIGHWILVSLRDYSTATQPYTNRYWCSAEMHPEAQV